MAYYHNLQYLASYAAVTLMPYNVQLMILLDACISGSDKVKLKKLHRRKYNAWLNIMRRVAESRRQAPIKGNDQEWSWKLHKRRSMPWISSPGTLESGHGIISACFAAYRQQKALIRGGLLASFGIWRNSELRFRPRNQETGRLKACEGMVTIPDRHP